MPDWPDSRGQFIALDTDYGVSTGNTAAQNATAIQQAITDVGPAAIREGQTIWLPGYGTPYPCNQLTLPNYPIHFIGDGPTHSILQIPGVNNTALLTYNNALGMSTTVGGRFSNQRGAGSPPQSGVPYMYGQWVIENLGFANLGNGQLNPGWAFPQWAGSVSLYDRLTLWANNCNVIAFDSTGIQYLINGCWNDSYLSNIICGNGEGIGFELGSDLRCVNIVAANNGYEGIYVDGRNTQLVGVKSWSNGTLTHSRGIGLYVTGTGAGVLATNVDTQDNNAYGVKIQSAGKVTISDLKCDRDCADAAFSSGILIADSHDVQIMGGICTDSSGWSRTNPTGNMLHSIKVTNTGGNTNYNNLVALVQATTQGSDGNTATMGSPIDPASDLSGTTIILGDGPLGVTDKSPTGTHYVQAGGSVTVNRKYAVSANVAGVPNWDRSALVLGSGAVLRVL